MDFFEKGFRIDTEGFIGAIPGLFIFCDFRKVPSTDDLKSVWNLKFTMVISKTSWIKSTIFWEGLLGLFHIFVAGRKIRGSRSIRKD